MWLAKKRAPQVQNVEEKAAMSDGMFDAIEVDLQLSQAQRDAITDRIRRMGHGNPDGTVSRYYWIKFAREELAKAAEDAGHPAVAE